MTEVLKISGANATRINALVDLAGGWDAFVTRIKNEVEEGE